MALFSKLLGNLTDTPSGEDHIYLIDTENVRAVWTDLLDRMSDQDKVYVFYTLNSGAVSYEGITGILQYGKHIELMECFTGKNGLDFQLVSYLGYLIRDNEEANYCIVSDDGGYDAAVKFWEKRGIKIVRKTASEVSSKPVKRSRFQVKRAAAPKPQAVKKQEAPKQQPAKKEQPKQEAPKQQPTKKEQPKQEAPKQQPTKKEQPKQEAPKQQPAKKEQPKQEAPKQQPAKKEQPKQEAPKQQPAKKEQPKQEAPKQEVPKDKKYTVRLGDLSFLLPDMDPEVIVAIRDILEATDGPKDLARIHDLLEKHFRDERASEIYRMIKPELKKLFIPMK